MTWDRSLPLVPMTCAATVVGDVLLLEREQLLQAAALRRVLHKGGLLLAEARDLLLQLLIALTRVAQVNVVGPETAHTCAAAVQELLHGRDQAHRPATQQCNGWAVRLARGAVRPARPRHLHGQHDHLHQHDRDQGQRILEAVEKGVHRDREQGVGNRK